MVYSILLFLVLPLALSNRIDKYSISFYTFFLFCCLFLFISFRINTGNDWDGYYNYLLLTREGEQVDVDFLMNIYYKLATFFDYDVFFISFLSFISFILFFMVGKNYTDSNFIVFFVLIGTGMIFFINNQMRQSIAMALWLLAIINFKKKERARGFLIYITALFTHASSILLFPLLRSYNIIKSLAVVIPSVFILLHFTPIFNGSQNLIFDLIPSLALDRYASKLWLFESSTDRGFIVLFWYFVYIIPVLFAWKSIDKHLVVISMIGIVLKIIFYDSHLITRYTNYLLYVNVILLINFLHISKDKLLNVFMIMLLIAYHQFIIYLEGGEHGGIPYYNVIIHDVEPNSGRGT